MNIAVVDDEKYWRDCATRKIEEYYDKLNVEIDLYESGNSFIEKEKLYDMVLMDVEMPGKNGFDTLIDYKVISNECIYIILTSHMEISNKGYLVDAFRYVNKLNMSEELDEAFKSADIIMETNKTISLNVVNLGKISLIIKDIIYIETVKRNVLVYTNDNTFECSNSISSLEGQLENCGFYRSHKSYLINLDRVKDFDRKQIYFANNKRAYLSSRKYAEMKYKYIERKITVANM